MSAYFVTAIGTDIGKTYVSASLLASWRESGLATEAAKPLMSGFDETELDVSDAGFLLQAMGRPVTAKTVSEICLHRFAEPIAPNVAMRKADMAQDYDAILDFTRQKISSDPQMMTLVEGAGGVMSPVTDKKLFVDLMADLALPVILVAGNYLGAVSHTLTAIECLRTRGLDVALLIASQNSADGGDPAHLLSEIELFQSVRSVPLHYQGSLQAIAKELSTGADSGAAKP